MSNVLNVSGRTRLPLSRHPCLDVPSLDEASAIYSRMTAPVHIYGLASKVPFSWRVNYLELGPLALVASETTSSVWADCEGASDAHLLSIPLGEASAESTIGRAVTPVTRGRSGVLCAPWQSSKVVVGSGFQGLQVTLPRGSVLAGMTTLTGSEPREIRFEKQFALDSSHVAPFMRLIAYVLREAEDERPEFAAPDAGEQLAEALIIRFLLSQPHSQSALFAVAVKPAEPRHVRRAAEYIDANFERSITVGELTRVTGVSARSLQSGFKKHRGCSPLDFVRARRLERARVLLITSDTSVTVSEVAQLAGVGHLGRFSIRYRKRFGESPTHTLARRWRFSA